MLVTQYFCSTFHIRIVPRRFPKRRVAFCVIVKRKLHFNFMTHRVGHVFHDGVAWPHAKMKEHQLAVSATRRGFPVATSVGPTCYCAGLPIIPIQKTLVLIYGHIFKEKRHQVARFIKIHISYQAVQLPGMLSSVWTVY